MLGRCSQQVNYALTRCTKQILGFPLTTLEILQQFGVLPPWQVETFGQDVSLAPVLEPVLEPPEEQPPWQQP